MNEIVIEPLSRLHDRKHFDCGQDDLNEFLRTRARKHAEQSVSTTWVACISGESGILGFVTFSLGAVASEWADPEVFAGLPKYPLPVLHVGRLAVDVASQGKGVGSVLLRFAALKAIEISTLAGCYALELVAKDQSVFDYYLRRGFLPLKKGSMNLYLPISSLKVSLGKVPPET